MRISLYPHRRNVTPDAVASQDVIVVDTLRATTTIAVALAGGAEVEPIAGVGAARRRVRALGRRALLAGERGGLRLPGFDVGNSPAELAQRDDLAGRRIVLTTSNGTQVIRTCARARRIYTVALVNTASVANHVAAARSPGIAIVCAGRSSGIALEDLVAAGAFIAALRGHVSSLQLSDGARLALDLFALHRRRLRALLRGCDSGRYLRSIGASADVDLCSEVGRYPVVPRLQGARFCDAARRARAKRTS
jgi:2-phosphosulfolactate phosphatase